MRRPSAPPAEPPAQTEVVCGPVCAGKTEELQRQVTRSLIAGRPAVVFRPSTDGKTAIVSHAGRTLAGVRVRVVDPAGPRPHVRSGTRLVALDEVQFLPPETALAWVAHWRARGIAVLVVGLDMYHTGEPCPTTAALLAVAESFKKLRAVCVRCRADATRSRARDPLTPRVAPTRDGAPVMFEPVCFACWASPPAAA